MSYNTVIKLKKMRLSIAVITMNRADQLKEALQSCVNSKLPDDTEFVIVDNASSDNTKDVVESFFADKCYSYKYEYQEKNLGVGGGRNRAYELAEGEFAYFLDDDAVINPEDYDVFFMKPLSLFEKYSDVATITTNIIDKAWQTNRKPISAKSWKRGNYDCIYMYFGGSHFLRCSVFRDRYSLYANIMYGFEELTPSVYAMDHGYVHLFVPEIAMIHCPKVNKWKDKDFLRQLNLNVICTQFYLKTKLYPQIVKPILWMAFRKRLSIYASESDVSNNMKILRDLDLHEEIITVKTLFRLIWQFKFSAF